MSVDGGGQSGLVGHGKPNIGSRPATYPEISANAVLVLLTVACSLLDRQLATEAKALEDKGGFTERLYRVGSENRKSKPSPGSIRSTKSTLSTDD